MTPQAPQLIDQELIDVAFDVLQFNTLLLTLLLAAQGFAIARLWPEGRTPPRAYLWSLAPAFVLAVVCVVIVAKSYQQFAVAASSPGTAPTAFKEWLNAYWTFYYTFAASVVFTSWSIFRVRKNGEAR